MATSETQIANMALAHVGNGSQIANMNEKSNEARACLLFYEQCRDEVLSAFPWPFTTRVAALALVATDPTTDWRYSYRYPSDALTIRLIPSGYDRWQADGAVPAPFRIISDATGKLIYTDWPNASVEYTVLEDDVTKFGALFTSALSYLLGSKIAPIVTGGDQFKLGPAAFQHYQMALSEARSQAANEEGRDPPPDSEFITVRY